MLVNSGLCFPQDSRDASEEQALNSSNNCDGSNELIELSDDEFDDEFDEALAEVIK